ncbi:hypothetical protein LTR36_007556 [Oleoguttula mirabilis]|uniref:Uncharacterized protein n=1 Tax=Oleoguttula mirabilis TaxID=1507867 RepID=A0AAV9JU71_9PEZI|nr:hypothetical protein LTR36_007556 [Oleoguttula mirabilis]
MSYYPGQGHHNQQAGGYPPAQQYSGYPPPQQYAPPQQPYSNPSPQPAYNSGYGAPPPPSYGYQQTPPPVPAGYGYGQPPQNGPSPPQQYQQAFQQGQQYGKPPPPPQNTQGFGHGAPSGYTFQYSNCSGRRKALLIGSNYFSQRGELRGCINDVKNMSTYLNGHFGYKREDMVILTDDQQNPMSQPTKANILRAMHWLVKDAQPNDSLFFHYSGHGGQTPDLDGDEEDGYDEVIYPVDFRQAGHIVDDEMHRIMVQPLQPGVRLTAIFDSCHSGSALDLPYIYSTQGVLKEPNLAKEAGQGLLSIVSSYARGDLGGVASSAMGFFKKATGGNDAYERNMRTKTSPADVVMWSGSKDSQTSQDANIAGQATGAMSWAFIAALKKNPQQSYVQLLNSIREELEAKYTQKPQLSCSHPLGTYGSQNASSNLPIIDLGYERQQATIHNETGYFFNNVRYAAPPTGENRFRAPQTPAVNRSVVQQGTQDRICPQASPAWGEIAEAYIPLYLGGQTVFNQSEFNTSSATSSLPVQDPATTEDCLFLDVVVPEAIFDNAGNGWGAPVLVWIYGGGYTEGSKAGSGSPVGLLTRSESNKAEGVIYVSLNYRLGAFGWLSGPSLQADGAANAGLLDQRLALEWVQSHIAKFGGDPNRVTVFGESAGGGSIMHQITAYGGLKGPVPFQQAVPQSPGFQPVVSNQQQEATLNEYLHLLNVTTIEQARKLPYSALQTANIIQVGYSAYGSFTYGPTVDGDFVPQLPGQLLLHGQYDKSLRLMIGHNADEGLLFTSPFIQNNSAFAAQVEASFPTINAWPSVLEYVTNVLYPPIFTGQEAQGYTNQIGRAAALVSEAVFTCNTFFLDKAYGNNTYAYFFTVGSALHGSDIPYTYYNGNSSTVLNASIAIALQEYITHFAETGTPNEAGVPYFVMYGANSTVQDLNISSITEVMDPTANQRCNWWQKALYV